MSRTVKNTIKKNRHKTDMKRCAAVQAFLVFTNQQPLKKRISFCWKVLWKEV